MQVSQIPDKISKPFAAAGGKNTIPVPSQIGVTPGAASFTDGFPPLTRTPVLAGGVPPFGLDMNGILFDITAVQQWQSAGGNFKYDAAFSTAIGGYPKGATLISAANDAYWISTADDNTTDPDGVSPANWALLGSYGIGAVTGLTNANVTLTPAQYNKKILTLAGALTGDLNITFPVNQTPIRVINNTTGAFTVSCKTAGGIAYAVVQGGQEGFYGDGTNLIPALGNTPPKFDNSKRVVTSEFVKRVGMQHGAPITFSASGSIPAVTGTGCMVDINGNGAPITLTLPQSSACDSGSIITFTNTSLYAVTVNAYAGEQLNPGNTGVSSVIVDAGESLCISLKGTIWVFFAGTAALRYWQGFMGSLVGNGYQKLPNGFILQWGTVTTAGTALGGTFTYPIAFPNNGLMMLAGAKNNNVPAASALVLSPSTFRVISRDFTGAYTIDFIQWIAIGY